MTSTTTASLFQPCVTVSDDGTITVDWSDSYSNSWTETRDHEDMSIMEEEQYVEPAGNPHSTLLDSLVVGVSTADGLRRLADHIEQAV
jgi:hypothetical protein